MSTPIAQVGLIHGAGFEFIEGVQHMSQGTQHHAERAAGLLMDGTIERAICSGLGPVRGETYAHSEAQMMADHLVGLGIPHQKIELEDLSTSAMGNWVKSAPIIQGLGVETVMGVTSRLSVPRMQMIGQFIGERAEFEVVGYTPSLAEEHLTDYFRELAVGRMTKRFLATEQDTPLDRLDEAYDALKERFGVATVKRLVHRQKPL